MDRRRYAMEYQREGMGQAESVEAASRRVYAEAQFRQSFQDAVITLTHTPEYMAAELHVRLDMIRDHIDITKEHIFDDIVVPVRHAVEAAAEAVITEIERRSDASGRSDD
jgi:hypothetical protein